MTFVLSALNSDRCPGIVAALAVLAFTFTLVVAAGAVEFIVISALV